MEAALRFAKVGDTELASKSVELMQHLGDVVVQRGTTHRWLKIKDGRPVKMLVCLIDGRKTKNEEI